MIGRGTRLLEPKKMKPWCLEKDKFLIMDCWENFEYFQMNPQGKTERDSKPIPVRLFQAKLQKLNAVDSAENQDLRNKVIESLKQDITKLPENNVVILDSRSKLDKVDDTFWQKLTDDKKLFLEKEVAPLMRTRTGEDYKAMSFELKVLNYSIEKLNPAADPKKLETMSDAIVEMVSDLPLTVNVVAREEQLINEIVSNNYIARANENELDLVIEKIAPLMKYREEGIKPDQTILDLRDITAEKEYIKFGPENERITIQKYREKVEALITELEEKNEILKKIKSGEPVTQEEVEELADVLDDYDPYPTEENLQKAYDARQVKFLDLIKYIMGIGDLVTFSEKVTEAFSEFIAEHNTMSAKQIQFLQTLQLFIIENGKLEKKDLVNEPFTKIHANGFLGLFTAQLQKEILSFTNTLLQNA